MRKYENIIISIIYIIGISVLSHYLFSWMGFNPTDDGFTLAYSRRILDGQVPHRDFIIIRPALSPIIHIPIILLEGEKVIWFSRLFVWVEIACISWFWILILDKISNIRLITSEKICFALLIFAFNIHDFPIMAWHTIDGILFITLGIFLVLQNNKLIGYFLIALSYLCKQNFLFVGPCLLIILGDWKDRKYLYSIIMPGFLYVLVMLVYNAFPDVLIQLTSQKSFLSVGFVTYFKNWLLYFGLIIGYCIFHFFLQDFSVGESTQKSINGVRKFFISCFVLVIFFALCMILGSIIKISAMYYLSFLLFGIVIGYTSCYVIKSLKFRKQDYELNIALVILLIGWSVSLSLGYNTPALVSGIFIVFLIIKPYKILKEHNCFYLPELILLTLFVFSTFSFSRSEKIYRDQSSSNLTYRIDNVFPCGTNIYTNINTYNYLLDLHTVISKVKKDGLLYAIIPDNSGYWICSSQSNPLPIDWAQGTELNEPRLLNETINSLSYQKGNLIIIVQKFQASTLADGLIPLPINNHHYEVVEYVRTNFTKIDETFYFELYK